MSFAEGFDLNRRSFIAAGAVAGAVTGALGDAGLTLAQAQTSAPSQSSAAAPPPSSAVAARATEASRDAIIRISREVWAHGELSLAEVESAKVHVRELQAAGFRIVSTGTAGIPTAFVAEWNQGSGGPVIAFLPEYDALPQLGNAAEPVKKAGPTPHGHGCGHNLIGAGATGAAFVLKTMMEQARTAGTIRVYGCAAEETEGAKVYMVRAGLFKDVDAAIAWHPGPVAAAGTFQTAAINQAKITFRGKTGHAGNSPWEGRSALKAAELFGSGIQYMREHIQTTARVHYIYEQAGAAPNVVPDIARVYMMMREVDRPTLDRMTDWIRQIADGAAMMTQTKAEFDLFIGFHDLMPNEPLARLALRHMNAVNLNWTAEEQAFARACQKSMGLPETGMATRALPFIEGVKSGGGTDVGDISYVCPTAVFVWPSVPQGIGLHTWPVTACGGMSIGDKASLDAARIQAAMGFDLMTTPELLQATRADFRRRRGDKPFVSALPEARKEPLGLPEFLRKTGADEVIGTL